MTSLDGSELALYPTSIAAAIRAAEFFKQYGTPDTWK